jgi:hypothetical protein
MDGYFDESVGSNCVDAGFTEGTLGDVDLAILLVIRKKNLWPIEERIGWYSEDDFFDIIEFLFQHVSKPVDGTMHNYTRNAACTGRRSIRRMAERNSVSGSTTC